MSARDPRHSLELSPGAWPAVKVPAAGRLHPAVIPALLFAGAEAITVASCGSSEAAYSRWLVDWWLERDRPGGFAIVEHDVEIAPTMLQQFAECPEPWCVAPYRGGAEALLGCTRFRPAELPDVRVHELVGAHWKELDMRLYRRLLDAGRRPHKHRPAPRHHHGWDRR